VADEDRCTADQGQVSLHGSDVTSERVEAVHSAATILQRSCHFSSDKFAVVVTVLAVPSFIRLALAGAR
jgi:hypothetical protein